MCTLGMVEMFVGVVQVPSPELGSMETPKLCPFCIITSSLLIFVPPCIEGDPVDKARLEVCPIRFDCSKPSIRARCSKINLSPASSLIPGSL